MTASLSLAGIVSRVRVAPSILLLRGCRRRPRGGRRFAPALHLFVVAESLDELAGRLDLGEVRAFELDGRHRPSLHLRRKSGVRGRERANPCMPKQQRHFKNSATHLAGVVIAVGGRFAARREVGSREPVSRPRARRDVVVRAFHRQRRSSAGQRVCSASVKPDQPLRTSDRSTRRRVQVLVLPPGSRQSEAAGGKEIRRRGGRIGARGVRVQHRPSPSARPPRIAVCHPHGPPDAQPRAEPTSKYEGGVNGSRCARLSCPSRRRLPPRSSSW